MGVKFSSVLWKWCLLIFYHKAFCQVFYKSPDQGGMVFLHKPVCYSHTKYKSLWFLQRLLSWKNRKTFKMPDLPAYHSCQTEPGIYNKQQFWNKFLWGYFFPSHVIGSLVRLRGIEKVVYIELFMILHSLILIRILNLHDYFLLPDIFPVIDELPP